MSRLLVDTDVASFVFKNHPLAALYERELEGHTLLISFMTIAELERWAIQSNWGEGRRGWLGSYVERFVLIPYNRALCTKWAEVTVAAQRLGRRIECADAWIAATALLHNVPLVTHNASDYAGVLELRLVSR
jgi:predicted nucleic acid-binding protein